MFEINLVPEIQKQKQLLAKRNTQATLAAISIVGVVVVVIVVLGSLKVAASLSLNNTNNKIAEIRNESEKYKELEEAVLSLESGLRGISKSLDGQNNWTVLMPHLEKATPKDIQFTSLDIEGNSLLAQLKGKNVDSIARFIESYRSYQIFILRGTDTPQSVTQITVDGNSIGKATVKSDGSWVYAVVASPAEGHTFETSSANTSNQLVYSADTKTTTSTAGNMTAQIANLFTNINTKQFSKEAGTVTFDASLTILTEALW